MLLVVLVSILGDDQPGLPVGRHVGEIAGVGQVFVAQGGQQLQQLLVHLGGFGQDLLQRLAAHIGVDGRVAFVGGQVPQLGADQGMRLHQLDHLALEPGDVGDQILERPLANHPQTQHVFPVDRVDHGIPFRSLLLQGSYKLGDSCG